jgi:hypothetical protein
LPNATRDQPYAYGGHQNQELINRAGLNHQPGPEEHDPRNDVLTSAKRAEERKHTKYDARSVLSPFALETTGGHGASTASLWLLLKKQMRYSALPADVLLGKLSKDISFALRRGTIAKVTTHHHALDGQRALVRVSSYYTQAPFSASSKKERRSRPTRRGTPAA